VFLLVERKSIKLLRVESVDFGVVEVHVNIDSAITKGEIFTYPGS